MHAPEPYYAWRNHYIASNDLASPFTTGSTMSLPTTSRSTTTTSTHNGMSLGAKPSTPKCCTPTTTRATVLEFIGEWNDCLFNDIMLLKRRSLILCAMAG